MIITNIKYFDPHNVGDWAASPFSYFDFPHMDKMFFNMMDYAGKTKKFFNPIFGGGGLLFHSDRMKYIFNHSKGAIVTWGLGANTHDSIEVNYPDFFDKATLNGVRDCGTKWDWVPCASCMSSLFDISYDITNKFVIYEHKGKPIRIEGILKENNGGSDLESKIKFIGSAEVVITNTYHGMYWATLLGKKVVLIDPFSSRFFGFKYTPQYVNLDNWKDKAKSSVAYKDALEECRFKNIQFYSKVMNVLGDHKNI